MFPSAEPLLTLLTTRSVDHPEISGKRRCCSGFYIWFTGLEVFKSRYIPQLRSVQAAHLYEFIVGSLLPPVAFRGENKLNLSWLDVKMTESCDGIFFLLVL